MTTVAVMQPYFLPYAGYFRLFAEADLVCLFDCVQFPRRGWVHRNQLPGYTGAAKWLTLPLAKRPMAIRIDDLAFAPSAETALANRCRGIPSLREASHPIFDTMLAPEGDVVDYLTRLLGLVCQELRLPVNILRTSTLRVPDTFSGQDRVLEVLRQVQATRYINLAGGRRLYQPEAFRHRAIELSFFEEWRGSRWSILHRLLTEPAHQIAREIHAQA
jgi:hypothetical protein